MKTVAMFNNKGGVGKTTLTCNLASFIGEETDLRVLVVDCDPQCNTTQLMLGVDRAAEIYLSDSGANRPTTIRDVLKPFEQGDSSIAELVRVVKGSSHRFGVDLLPGDPGLAILEDQLGQAWQGVKGRDFGGFRQTNWNAVLRGKLETEYDLVIFDLGPSLGSINRSVLMGCDHFATPLSSDIFSIIGVRNISSWLADWIADYDHSWGALKPAEQSELTDQFGVLPSPRIRHGYAGYTIQQYITKSYSGVRRATSAYEAIISKVDGEIAKALSDFYVPSISDGSGKLKLGEIPHLFSLVPLAQRKAVPIHGLKAADGLVGSQYAALREFEKNIRPVANNLLLNIGLR